MEIKRLIFIIAFLLFLINIINIVHADTNETNSTNISISTNKLKIGDSSEFEGKIVKVIRISSGSAVFEVGGEKQAIKVYEEKQINGVKIYVDNIFYVEEPEDRFVEIYVSKLFSTQCGNGNCETGEDKKNCCKDCGCASGYKCDDNYCRLINTGECSDNKDCDDHNSTTLDLCTGTPKKCDHKIVTECKKNEDCNDNNNCTNDECISNTCYNKKIDNCKQEVQTEKENITGNKSVENKEVLSEKKQGFFGSMLTFIKQKLFKLVNF
ncbi:MAG: hypothetical protein NT139_01010 [Candidatus Woesearchaeota archaeon]|nr:hypothetical protein [Candidatus Woesearchaeota archaeon]